MTQYKKTFCPTCKGTGQLPYVPQEDYGTNTYRTLHKWINVNFGSPMVCSNCLTTRKTRYHWANISGNYTREESDWKRLCASCHKKYDSLKVRRNCCKMGHKFTIENTCLTPKGTRICIKCRRINAKKYRLKLKGIV